MPIKSLNTHHLQVQKLQKLIIQSSGPTSLHHSSPSNTLRHSYTPHSLDLSSLNAILEFNPSEQWILVEPRITFSALCAFTLKHNLMPPVVPEFRTITVGGAIMGAAIESSSHLHGQVSDNCLWYEVLLGNGELTEASPTHNPDLFYGLSASYGTIGLLTAVKLKLIPSLPYVKLTYHWDQLSMLKTTSDCIEGIVYSPTSNVVIHGDMTATKPKKIYEQKHYWSSWYFHHVQKNRPQEEFMPLEDYLFRHDRGAFWIGRYILSTPVLLQLITKWGIPQIMKIPPEPSLFFRLLFGWYFSSQDLYKIWHRVPKSISEKIFFIHDFYAPISTAMAVLEKIMQEIHIYPLWLCPVKGTSTPQFLSPHFGSSDFLNIGVYGIPPYIADIPALSARWENEIVKQGGRKMLYSLNYYEKEHFDQIYDIPRYEALRKKFNADERFPTLYNKVVLC